MHFQWPKHEKMASSMPFQWRECDTAIQKLIVPCVFLLEGCRSYCSFRCSTTYSWCPFYPPCPSDRVHHWSVLSFSLLVTFLRMKLGCRWSTTDHLWSNLEEFANDQISVTCSHSCAGGIHQGETSNLWQVCGVKRVCIIRLGTLTIKPQGTKYEGLRVSK